MIEFISELHFGWWFLAHTLIMIACFISLDNYNYKRTIMFANAIEEINKKLELIQPSETFEEILESSKERMESRLGNSEE
tara:strand:- start:525 stop:764 length:240 start_codon:yes stop_codon:yes gene_type:complete